MALGAFAPWGKSVGLINVSISGTDGANDGWLVVGSAAAGALCALWYSRGARLAALGVVLAGVAGAAVTIYDRGNLTDVAEANTSDLISLEVGWGLNLAMGASVVLAIIGAIALLGSQSAPGMRVAPATDPAAEAAAAGVARVESSPSPDADPRALAEPPAVGSTTGELERLADLQARGMLTDEEFRAAKQRLLGM
jgi:hypothetical protein